MLIKYLSFLLKAAVIVTFGILAISFIVPFCSYRLSRRKLLIFPGIPIFAKALNRSFVLLFRIPVRPRDVRRPGITHGKNTVSKEELINNPSLSGLSTAGASREVLPPAPQCNQNGMSVMSLPDVKNDGVEAGVTNGFLTAAVHVNKVDLCVSQQEMHYAPANFFQCCLAWVGSFRRLQLLIKLDMLDVDIHLLAPQSTDDFPLSSYSTSASTLLYSHISKVGEQSGYKDDNGTASTGSTVSPGVQRVREAGIKAFGGLLLKLMQLAVIHLCCRFVRIAVRKISLTGVVECPGNECRRNGHPKEMSAHCRHKAVGRAESPSILQVFLCHLQRLLVSNEPTKSNFQGEPGTGSRQKGEVRKPSPHSCRRSLDPSYDCSTRTMVSWLQIHDVLISGVSNVDFSANLHLKVNGGLKFATNFLGAEAGAACLMRPVCPLYHSEVFKCHRSMTDRSSRRPNHSDTELPKHSPFLTSESAGFITIWGSLSQKPTRQFVASLLPSSTLDLACAAPVLPLLNVDVPISIQICTFPGELCQSNKILLRASAIHVDLAPVGIPTNAHAADIIVSFDKLAEGFFLYWRLWDLMYPLPPATPEPFCDESFDANVLDVDAYSLPIVLSVPNVRIRLFENSHPTIFTLKGNDFQGRINACRALFKLKFVLRGVTTIDAEGRPHCWWREQADADVKDLLRETGSVASDSLTRNNASLVADLSNPKPLSAILKVDNTSTSESLLQGEVLSFCFLMTKKPRFPYKQHVRFNADEICLTWSPDGFLNVVHLILHTIKTYRKSRLAVYARREKRILKGCDHRSQLNDQPRTAPKRVCPQCGCRSGSRVCHGGVREDDWAGNGDTAVDGNWPKARLRLSDVAPAAVPLDPIATDISAACAAVADIGAVEKLNKDTFDVKIRRVYVIADPCLAKPIKDLQEDASTLTTAEIETSGVKPYQRVIIAQVEEFAVHLCTTSKATIIGTSTILLLEATRGATPPPYVSENVIDVFNRSVAHLADCESYPVNPGNKTFGHVQMPAPATWALVGVLDHGFLRIPTSTTGASSVQVGDLWVNWTAHYFAVLWLVSEGIFADYLMLKKWITLTAELIAYRLNLFLQDYNYGSSGGSSDLIVTTGSLWADLGDGLKSGCDGILIRKDGMSGSVDAAVDKLWVRIGANCVIDRLTTSSGNNSLLTTESLQLTKGSVLQALRLFSRESPVAPAEILGESQSLSGDPVIGSPQATFLQRGDPRLTVSNLPPLLTMSRLRVWSGYEKFILNAERPFQEKKTDHFGEQPPSNHNPSAAEKCISNASLAKSMKIYIDDLEASLPSDSAASVLFEGITEALEGIYYHCFPPDSLYMLARAAKPAIEFLRLPPPNSFLSVRITRGTLGVYKAIGKNISATIPSLHQAKQRSQRRNAIQDLLFLRSTSVPLAGVMRALELCTKAELTQRSLVYEDYLSFLDDKDILEALFNQSSHKKLHSPSPAAMKRTTPRRTSASTADTSGIPLKKRRFSAIGRSQWFVADVNPFGYSYASCVNLPSTWAISRRLGKAFRHSLVETTKPPKTLLPQRSSIAVWAAVGHYAPMICFDRLRIHWTYPNRVRPRTNVFHYALKQCGTSDQNGRIPGTIEFLAEYAANVNTNSLLADLQGLSLIIPSCHEPFLQITMVGNNHAATRFQRVNLADDRVTPRNSSVKNSSDSASSIHQFDLYSRGSSQVSSDAFSFAFNATEGRPSYLPTPTAFRNLSHRNNFLSDKLLVTSAMPQQVEFNKPLRADTPNPFTFPLLRLTIPAFEISLRYFKPHSIDAEDTKLRRPHQQAASFEVFLQRAISLEFLESLDVLLNVLVHDVTNPLMPWAEVFWKKFNSTSLSETPEKQLAKQPANRGDDSTSGEESREHWLDDVKPSSFIARLFTRHGFQFSWGLVRHIHSHKVLLCPIADFVIPMVDTRLFAAVKKKAYKNNVPRFVMKISSLFREGMFAIAGADCWTIFYRTKSNGVWQKANHLPKSRGVYGPLPFIDLKMMTIDSTISRGLYPVCPSTSRKEIFTVLANPSAATDPAAVVDIVVNIAGNDVENNCDLRKSLFELSGLPAGNMMLPSASETACELFDSQEGIWDDFVASARRWTAHEGRNVHSRIFERYKADILEVQEGSDGNNEDTDIYSTAKDISNGTLSWRQAAILANLIQSPLPNMTLDATFPVFPPPLLQRRRPRACLGCRVPFLIDVQPATVASWYQLASNIDSTLTQNRLFSETSMYCSTPPTTNNPAKVLHTPPNVNPFSLLKEYTPRDVRFSPQAGKLNTDISDGGFARETDSPELAAFPFANAPRVGPSKDSYAKYFAVVTDTCRRLDLRLRQWSFAVNVSSAFLRIGTVRLSAAEVYFVENWSLKERKKTAASETSSSQPQSCGSQITKSPPREPHVGDTLWNVMNFLRFMTENVTTSRKVQVQNPAIFLPTEENHVFPLCQHAAGGVVTPPDLTRLALLANLLLPDLRPPQCIFVLPVLRAVSLEGELQNLSEVFVSVHEPKLFISLYTLPMAMHSLALWELLRQAMTSYFTASKIRSNLHDPKLTTPFSCVRERLPDPLLERRQFLPGGTGDASAPVEPAILKCIIRTTGAEANVQWLDLTRWLASQKQNASRQPWRPGRPCGAEQFWLRFASKRMGHVSHFDTRTPWDCTSATIDKLLMRPSTPLFTAALASDLKICTVSQARNSSRAPTLLNKSIEPLGQYDLLIILATLMNPIEPPSWWPIDEKFARHTPVQTAGDAESSSYSMRIKGLTPSPSYTGSRRQSLQLILAAAVGKYGILLLPNLAKSSNARLTQLQCIRGPIVESLDWDILHVDKRSFGSVPNRSHPSFHPRRSTAVELSTHRTPLTAVSWKQGVSPLEACQLVVATPQLVLRIQLTLDIWNIFQRRSKPFVGLNVLARTGPLVGQIGALHMNGLLWANEKSDEWSSFHRSPPRDDPENLGGLESQVTPENPCSSQPRVLDSADKFLTGNVGEACLEEQSFLEYGKSAILRGFLHTVPLSFSCGTSLPFRRGCTVRAEIPVVVLTASSLAARQFFQLATEVLTNCDFLTARAKHRQRSHLHRDRIAKELLYIKSRAVNEATDVSEAAQRNPLEPQKENRVLTSNEPTMPGFIRRFLDRRGSGNGGGGAEKTPISYQTPQLGFPQSSGATSALTASEHSIMESQSQAPEEVKIHDVAITKRAVRRAIALYLLEKSAMPHPKWSFASPTKTNSVSTKAVCFRDRSQSVIENQSRQSNVAFAEQPVVKARRRDGCADALYDLNPHLALTRSLKRSLSGAVSHIKTAPKTLDWRSAASPGASSDSKSSGITDSELEFAAWEDGSTSSNDDGATSTDSRDWPHVNSTTCELRVDCEVQQFAFSLVIGDCIFSRLSASEIAGTFSKELAADQETRISFDVGDVSLESVPPSKHAFASGHIQESSPQRRRGPTQQREQNQVVLRPLLAPDRLAPDTGVLAFRGRLRILHLCYGRSMSTNGAPILCDTNAENSLSRVRFYDSLMLQTCPFRVDLSQKLLEDIYRFIFPPSTDREGIQTVNPLLPIPPTPVTTVSNTLGAISNSANQRENVSRIPEFTYIKYIRIAPLFAIVDYSGGPVSLKDAEVHLKAFVRSNRLCSIRTLVDTYMWSVGRQATAAVISHKVRGWLDRTTRPQNKEDNQNERRPWRRHWKKRLMPPLADVV